MINEGQVSSYRTSSPQSLGGSPIIGSGDPHHNRAPSLGEIHQELEQEQEAQVVCPPIFIVLETQAKHTQNRLLQMIRLQQQQLQALQSASGHSHSTPSAIDDSTPTSERSMSFPNVLHNHSSSISTPRSPTAISIPQAHPRSSLDLARRSRTPSRNASPRLRSTSISGEGSGENWSLGGGGSGSAMGRDESAFYQAETQMMIRENQMLRQRIRELGQFVTSRLTFPLSLTKPNLTANRAPSQRAPRELGHYP